MTDTQEIGYIGKPLFKHSNAGRKPKGVSRNDEENDTYNSESPKSNNAVVINCDYSNLPELLDDDQEKLFGITLNIQPTKLMNKRPWREYTHDEQRAILMRIENAFRRKTPACVLLEIHFEICPKLKNIHYHALYKMPPIYVNEIHCYFKRICCAQDSNTREPWRYLDVKPIIDGEQQWLNYIRKDMNK